MGWRTRRASSSASSMYSWRTCLKRSTPSTCSAPSLASRASRCALHYGLSHHSLSHTTVSCSAPPLPQHCTHILLSPTTVSPTAVYMHQCLSHNTVHTTVSPTALYMHHYLSHTTVHAPLSLPLLSLPRRNKLVWLIHYFNVDTPLGPVCTWPRETGFPPLPRAVTSTVYHPSGSPSLRTRPQ
jgi:hypothetical protein